MKKKLFLILSIIILSMPVVGIYAKTIDQLNKDAEEAQKEYDQKKKELDSKQLEYDEIEAEFVQVASDNKKLQSDIQETENSINQKRMEIADIQDNQIPDMQEKAGLSLQILQDNINSKFLLEATYNAVVNNGQSVIEAVSNSKNLFDGIKKSLVELMDLLEKVKEEEKQLEEKQSELEAQQIELAAQEDYLESLKVKLQQAIAEVEKGMADAKDIAEYNKNLADLAESNGCGPNDVIGVDCAQDSVPSDTGFIKPLPYGYVTQEFSHNACWNGGYYNCIHSGIDIGGNAEGTPVYPVASGKVLYSGNMGDGGGNSVMILHAVNGQNYVSRYEHLKYSSVSVGQTVTVGTPIGGVGKTGNVTGKHLHLEMEPGTQYVWANAQNPRNYINFPAMGIPWHNR